MSNCYHCGKQFDQSKSPYIGVGPKCGAKVPGFRAHNLELKSYTQKQLDNLRLSEEETNIIDNFLFESDEGFSAEFIFKAVKEIEDAGVAVEFINGLANDKEVAQLGKMVLEDKNMGDYYLILLATNGIFEAYQHPNFDFSGFMEHVKEATEYYRSELATALAIYKNPNLPVEAFNQFNDWLVSTYSNGESICAQAICDESIPVKNRVLLAKNSTLSVLSKEVIESVFNSKHKKELVPAFYENMDASVIGSERKNLATAYTDQLRFEKDQLRHYSAELHKAEKLNRKKSDISGIKNSIRFYEGQVEALEFVIQNHPSLGTEVKDLSKLFE